MGKNNKKTQANTASESGKKKHSTVSIVTITQFKRFECLEVLHDIIKSQTYKNIIEWVVVEGSKTQEDAVKNAENIKKLKERSDLGFPIVYLEHVPGLKLGGLRNRGNEACQGDITVCMDDDDFYPVDRVEHAVERLENSKAKIAGCSAVLIYDYFLDKLYKFKEFGPNHSTNNCMAWKKEHLKDNKHEADKEMAEESSFTKGFTEPMVQLDAKHTIVVSSHDANTFNKRELLVGGTHKINPTLSEVEEPITNYIKEPYYSRFRKLFYHEFDSKYDIVYLAGGFSIKWDPRDMSLGGSEQAIVNLVSNWAKMGKKVAVYGEIMTEEIAQMGAKLTAADKPDLVHNGVDYYVWRKFPFEAKFNTVVLWRLYGLWCGAPYPIKAKNIWLDCHDNFGGQFPETWKKYGKAVTKVLFKSEFHRDQFETHCGVRLDKSRYDIIPNGIRVEEFLVNKENVPRNPFRFCYCSCYMRGLIEILQYMWPIIYQYEPRAELHVYYGMDNVKDENAKNALKQLLAQPGVMDHGRQPMEMIIREKYMSNFHLYVTNTPIEIDCISIRESLATGAIPLLSNFGVFKDREGLHFDLNQFDPKSYQQIAFKVLNLLRQADKFDGYRQQMRKSPLLINWENTAKKWLELMN